MEHPTGEFASAVDAMQSAVERLRQLSEWNSWITFCAQGEGADQNSYRFAEVRLMRDSLQVETPINVVKIVALAQVPASALRDTGAGIYSMAGTTPGEVARILDAIFRHEFGVRPFADEKDDYAVGAEW